LDAVVFEGRPNPEQATALVKREELDRRVLAHAIPNSEAMQRFARGEVQIGTAVALAREYYPVCLEFPLFLSAAISHVRDERTRVLLVGNLYEEHGDLDPARTHPALFRQYVRALGLEPDALATPLKDSPGARVVERFSTVCREGPDYRALAMLYAFETLFSPACAMVASGLRPLPLAPGATLFFDVHAVGDVAHAEQLRLALFEACGAEEEWRVAVDTASEAGRLLYHLFDSVARVS
jgi:pyrroloquinoline-quinone synthase